MWTVEKDVFDGQNLPIPSADLVEKKLAKVQGVEWTFVKPDLTMKSSVKNTRRSDRKSLAVVVKVEGDLETM